jgi:crotonobetainyl-CoA:carnitine CoA-transferase CaiB-like acyl-CoA transferase
MARRFSWRSSATHSGPSSAKPLAWPNSAADPRLATNNDRVRAREWLMPLLRSHLADHDAAELSAVFEANALPFAPITRPQDLFDDPHLIATGGLAPITLSDGERAGTTAPTVLMPLTLGGERPGIRMSPPRLGEHTRELLQELGYGPEAIDAFQAGGITR